MISRIIKVEVRVVRRSRRPRPWLFWISQKPNLIIVVLYIERNKKIEVKFLHLHWRQATQSVRTWLWLALEMHRAHTIHDYSWPWVPFTWLLYNLQLGNVTGADFENFQAIRKEIVSLMLNNDIDYFQWI